MSAPAVLSALRELYATSDGWLVIELIILVARWCREHLTGDALVLAADALERAMDAIERENETEARAALEQLALALL